ncbi:hypothetical protein RRG08_043009 [Elysia crispata]|uniref:Uncharacterized protein n=1 Tax=Elysia crispata TaxID=231223 RepID=A0AAE0XYG9_9GAST|nr:hypothetical protein RRG08_043009 [Elysia crispata]
MSRSNSPSMSSSWSTNIKSQGLNIERKVRLEEIDTAQQSENEIDTAVEELTCRNPAVKSCVPMPSPKEDAEIQLEEMDTAQQTEGDGAVEELSCSRNEDVESCVPTPSSMEDADWHPPSASVPESQSDSRPRPFQDCGIPDNDIDRAACSTIDVTQEFERVRDKLKRVSLPSSYKVMTPLPLLSKIVSLLSRNLYRLLASRSSWQDVLDLDVCTVKDLEWWFYAVSAWNGKSFHVKPKDHIQLVTDASGEGWGGIIVDSHQEAQGAWDRSTSSRSSNFREISAVLMTLTSFLPLLKGKSRTSDWQCLTDTISDAGLEGLGFTSRSFRPSAATAAVASGLDPNITQQIGRWKTKEAKNRARAEKEEDKKLALSLQDGCMSVWTFDTQSVILCPQTKASALCFRTKLQAHNFTLFNNGTRDGFCYYWEETEGELKAENFVSIQYNHFKSVLASNPNIKS